MIRRVEVDFRRLADERCTGGTPQLEWLLH
jgi:hypothetical protein